MSQNTEKNFSLNEWVTRRAANGGGVVSASSSAQSEASEEDATVMTPKKADMQSDQTAMSDEGVVTMAATSSGRRVAVQPPSIHSQKSNSLPDESVMSLSSNAREVKPKTEQPVQNASVTPVSSIGGMVAAGQQIQIVRLLQDLGDRLRQSEKEREVLWRELESARRVITEMDDKLSKSEKMWVSIESRIGQDTQTQAEKQEREKERAEMMNYRRRIEEKLAALETTTGSALVRVEDALAESSKVSKRLEQTQNDRARLQRKIESLEDAVTQTQDALKAKALVLLTDHALANRTALPQTPAFTRDDAARISAITQPQAPQVAPVIANRVEQMRDPLAASRGIEKLNQIKNFFDQNFFKTLLVGSVVGLGLAGGWWLATQSKDIVEKNVTPAALSSQDTPIVQPASQTQEELMNDIARMANQIEPEAVDAKQNSKSADITSESQSPAELAQTLEQQAKAQFDGEKMTTAISARINADPNLPASVKEVETKAFNGDGEAQHDLAAIYTAGHAGVNKDLEKARVWFTESAHNGIANAQYNLAVLNHQGLGMAVNLPTAMMLYRLAAAQNHPEAQYNLGIAHIEGIGAQNNPALAAYYFEQAAANGIVEAAYNLGLIHENGLLGETQPDEAVFWYKLSADRGNAQARDALQNITKQLGMKDEDVNRIVSRINALKPDALGKRASDQANAKQNQAPQVTAKPTAAPSSNPTVTARIQDQLSKLGLYDGAADGVMNNATAEAIRVYQKNASLKVDGKPSEDLLVRLLASDMNLTAQ